MIVGREVCGDCVMVAWRAGGPHCLCRSHCGGRAGQGEFSGYFVKFKLMPLLKTLYRKFREVNLRPRGCFKNTFGGPQNTF